MKNELVVHHYHHNPRPKKQKKEGFWKGMGKLALSEAAGIGSLVVNETLDISDQALRTATLTENNKNAKR